MFLVDVVFCNEQLATHLISPFFFFSLSLGFLFSPPVGGGGAFSPPGCKGVDVIFHNCSVEESLEKILLYLAMSEEGLPPKSPWDNQRHLLWFLDRAKQRLFQNPSSVLPSYSFGISRILSFLLL